MTEKPLKKKQPRSNVGQVAHVSPTPSVALQKVDIMCRALEATCCGAGATTLPIATLILVHSYCAPVWCRNTHTRITFNKDFRSTKHETSFSVK